RAHRYELPGLRRPDVGRGAGGSRVGRGPGPLRGSCQGVVGRHRLHLKDDASLPVGRAHRPLVSKLGFTAGRGPVPGPGVAPRASLVRSGSPGSGMETPHRRRNGGVVPGARDDFRLLEPAIAAASHPVYRSPCSVGGSSRAIPSKEAVVKSILLALAFGLVLALPVAAQDATTTPPATTPPPAAAAATGHVMVTPVQVKWADGPPFLKKGAKFTVLSGDPGAAGPFTIRLRLPAGYRIAPHWHPTDENVTVISGTFSLGMGDTFDAKAAKSLTPGGYALLPAEMHHFAWTEG